MKCVINLFDDSETIEIVPNLDDKNINALDSFLSDKSWSYEELVEDIIEEYIKLRGL